MIARSSSHWQGGATLSASWRPIAAIFLTLSMLAFGGIGTAMAAGRGRAGTSLRPSVQALKRERSSVRIVGRHASCAQARGRSARSMCIMLQPFSQELVGGLNVVVIPNSSWWFFWASWGVSIKVNPESHWWCLWLCSSTTNVERITASIALTGANFAHGYGQCTNCGSMNVMGPTYWGYAVPNPFERVAWYGTIQVHGATYPFQGAALF